MQIMILTLELLYKHYYALCVGLSNGSLTAQKPSDIVSMQLLKEIEYWKKEGASDEDVICRLRPKTVPPGQKYSTWIKGETAGPSYYYCY